MSNDTCDDTPVGTLCQYAGGRFRGCPNWNESGFVQPPFPTKHYPYVVDFVWGKTAWGIKWSWANIFGHWCPRTCGFSPAFAKSIEHIVQGASLENVTACDFWAANGMCNDKVPSRMFELGSIFMALEKYDFKSGQNNDEISYTHPFWYPAALVLMQPELDRAAGFSAAIRSMCPRSCKVCSQSPNVFDSSYGQNSDTFCNSPAVANALGPPTPGNKRAACLIYTPSCCAWKDSQASACVGKWTSMMEYSYDAIRYNAFFKPRCGMWSVQPREVAVAVGLTLFLGVAIFFLGSCVMKWRALGMKVVHAARSKVQPPRKPRKGRAAFVNQALSRADRPSCSMQYPSQRTEPSSVHHEEIQCENTQLHGRVAAIGSGNATMGASVPGCHMQYTSESSLGEPPVGARGYASVSSRPSPPSLPPMPPPSPPSPPSPLSMHMAPPPVEEMLADPPERLVGVHVDSLAVALERHTGDEGARTVMNELFHGTRYLRRATDTDGTPLGKLAIISYRCVGSDEDGFTLDEHALRSAVLAAQQNGIEFIWLDGWAYRKQPPWATYQHAEFVRTLLAVMLSVEHVIWLPRSRATAAGEYQFRIWCTFEAMIVHFRQLPVTAAGHHLDALQTRLLCHGSWLFCLPWEYERGKSATCRSIRNLGRANLANLFFLIITLLYVALRVINVWNSNLFLEHSARSFTGSGWLVEVGLPVSHLAVGLLCWHWARRRLGQAVMFARNGSMVLDAMACAASGSKRPALDVAKLSATLPWLAAHDRRDTMTIKMVLDNVQRVCAGVDASRGDAAFAVSLFVHAWLAPSVADSPSGCGDTVRSWLKRAGIHLFDDAGPSQMLLSEEASAFYYSRHVVLRPSPSGNDGTTGRPPNPRRTSHVFNAPGDFLEARWQAWLDTPILPGGSAGDALPHGTGKRTSCNGRARDDTETSQGSDDHSHRSSRQSACSSTRGTLKGSLVDGDLRESASSLTVAALRDLQWTFATGVHEYVHTPIGDFVLEREPAISTAVEPIRLRIVRRLTSRYKILGSERTDAYLYTAIFYVWSCIYCVMMSHLLWQGFETSIILDDDPFFVAGVATDIDLLVLYLYLTLVVLLLGVAKLRSAWSDRCFPTPTNISGRLFYACFMAGLAVLVYFTALDRITWHILYAKETEGGLHFVGAATDVYPAFAIAVSHFATLTLLVACEVLLALIHAVVSTVRHRDLRYLLEFTAMKATKCRAVR